MGHGQQTATVRLHTASGSPISPFPLRDHGPVCLRGSPYAKTRPVFEQYKAAKYSRKFLAEHEADIELYRAAQAEMRRLLGGAKLPKMDALKEEGRKLTAKKKRLYGEYQKARRDMQEIVTIKANIDTLLGYTEPGRKQEKER